MLPKHAPISRRAFTAGGLAATLPISVLAQTTGQRLPIKIVNQTSTNGLALEELLKRQGYLEEMGISATTINVVDGSKVVASLVSGDMDVCMNSGFGPVLPAVARGAPIKLIAAAHLLVPQGLMTNSPAIRSPADLAGKTVGTGPVGALEYELMVAILLKYKVDPASVTFVNVGTAIDIFRSIAAGTIDAGPVNIDTYSRQTDKLRVIANFWTELRNFPNQGSYTSTATIAAKRAALVRTMAAYCQVYRYIETPESQEPYIKAYMAATNGTAAAAAYQWKFLYDNKVFATDLRFPPNALDFLQDLNVRTHVLKQKMPDSRFLDTSLIPEALKLIA